MSGNVVMLKAIVSWCVEVKRFLVLVNARNMAVFDRIRIIQVLAI